MKITSKIASLIFGMVFLCGAAVADGTHGVAVTVINKTGYKIEVMTYNSKDGSMTVPHKVYYIDAGGTRKAKAHGQGNNNLRMTVRHKGEINNKCLDDIGSHLDANKAKHDDGSTVIVLSCYSTDREGY